MTVGPCSEDGLQMLTAIGSSGSRGGGQARIQDFLQGGGGQRRPCTAGDFGARADGGLGLINIRLRYIASIEYSERFFLIFFFFC